MHDLDTTTDRLARRRYHWAVERDTYYWARLRLDIALRRSARTTTRDLIPAVMRLNADVTRASASIEGFAAAWRKGSDKGSEPPEA